MENNNIPAPDNNEKEIVLKHQDHDKLKRAYKHQFDAQQIRKQLSQSLSEILFEAMGAEGAFAEAQNQTQAIMQKIARKYVKDENKINRLYYNAETDKVMVSFNSPDSDQEIKTESEIESSSPDESTNQGDDDMNNESVRNDADVERDPAVTDPTLPPSVGQGEKDTAEDSGGTAEVASEETTEATEDNTSDDENNA